MDHANYVYRILHRPASYARALINGIPVYERAPDRNVAPMQPITHWLVTGENSIVIELTEAPPSPLAPNMTPHFAMMIMRAENLDDPRFRWEYPDSIARLGLEPRLPWAHEGVFVPEGELPPPVFLDSPREEFPIEGTPEQHLAVAELYEAFATRDAARFEAAMDLKFSQFERYYGPQPLSKHDAIQRMNAPWIMEPFDAQDLRFERHADGRVAYVRRASGKPAVRATHRDEPYLGWGSDFYMTRQDGRWRIFW